MSQSTPNLARLKRPKERFTASESIGASQGEIGMETAVILDSCPSCGRKVAINPNLLGLEISCAHCHKRFISEGRNLQTHVGLSKRIDDLLAGSN